ncbi:hypothetical protein EDC40_105286 [Aminobacter aminovorans]|uniref:Uncharacterized protein n=1 Tax=Aminobacter aminovorans TaxID=83263 RepID=A0A380WN14_AMIAI|nr:hypothetical protein [Aminobacter aminovorans]TCS26085.1 hypothetical protein EDC40_105286 [Aminobacter aminovorans]SUU90251.1 Uncharacterised protein [Aminobacter aminovorans]
MPPGKVVRFNRHLAGRISIGGLALAQKTPKPSGLLQSLGIAVLIATAFAIGYVA